MKYRYFLIFTHENRFTMGVFAVFGVIFALSNNVEFDKLMSIILFLWTLYESMFSIEERHNYFETVLSYVIGLSGMMSTYILIRNFIVDNDYTLNAKITLALIVFMLYIINLIYVNLYIILERKN